MGLTTQLTASLDCKSLGVEFLSNIAGPVADLAAVVVPTPGDAVQSVVSSSGSIEFSPATAIITVVAQQAQQIITTLPDAQAVLGTLNTAITSLENLTQNDLGAEFSTLLDRLKLEMQDPAAESRTGLLIRLLDLLSGAGEGKALHDLLAIFAQRAGVELPTAAPYLDGLRALDGVVGALSGMMCLETVLNDAERLSTAMTTTINPIVVQNELAILDALLLGEGTSLPNFIAGINTDDAASVNTAVKMVSGVAARLTSLHEQFSAALGMGEATLVYLDINRLQSEIDNARGLVRTADLEPLSRLMTAAAPLLQDFVNLNLSTLPAGNVAALLNRLEGEIAGVAADITLLDPARFVTPLTDGIQTLTTPLREVNQLVSDIMLTLRGALEQVRAAVAALPLHNIAAALHDFLSPITQILDTIRALLQDIEATLHIAADATTSSLNQIDGVLTTFKEKIDDLFAEAEKAVQAVNLDQVVGTISENIQAFSDLMSQAQMQPYFDTAVNSISSATDVVSAVPFDLLPESMKADVDAAVLPIKNTDVEAAQRSIENLLGITPDGKFSLRSDIDAAIEDIHTKYLALIKTVEDNDPRKLLADVDQKLKDVASKVHELTPDLTLQPVADAIDSVKQLISGIDLEQALQPVQDVFTQIDAELDRYLPSRLVAPLEQRIEEVRDIFIEQVRLDKWVPALDDLETRALSLLDMAGPAQIRPPLENALKEVMTLLNRFPQADTTRGFGTVIAGLLGSKGLRISPSSFPTVAAWIGGDSGNTALAARTKAIGAAFATTRELIDSLDLQNAGAGIITNMTALRSAVQELIGRLDGQSPEAARLSGLLPRLDVHASFADLTQNNARYLAELKTAAELSEIFARTGFSEVDVTLAQFRNALLPLNPAWQQLKRVLAALGIDPQQLSITGIVRAVLQEASPQRLVNILMPVFEAFRDRIQAVLTAIITPIKAAITDLSSLVDALDLTPLTEAADSAVTEIRSQIQQLSPSTLLKEPLDSFAQLKQALITNDPLAAVTEILTNLRDLITGILKKLSLEKLLESPLAIYQQIVDQLKQIDPTGLLDPIFSQLDDIARQVDTGLDQTVEAFKNLQDALPGGGGGSSASISVTT